jgi:hypothetical protein
MGAQDPLNLLPIWDSPIVLAHVHLSGKLIVCIFQDLVEI